MPEDRRTGGRAIARRLAAAIEREEAFGGLTVTDGEGGNVLAAGNGDAEPTPGGTFVCALERDGDRVAEVYAHPERARVEFALAPGAAAATAEAEGLRVRPKAVRPPRTLVFVESAAEVAPALAVVAGVREALD